jgi:hypothetical protein
MSRENGVPPLHLRVLRALIYKFIHITSHRAVVFTLTTRNLKRSQTQQNLAAKRFNDTLEGVKQIRSRNRRILKKLKFIKSLFQPHTETPKTLLSKKSMCIQIIRSLRPTKNLMIAVLFLVIITQSHATNPYHTWNRQNMLGDNISPCAHPNSFRITSTNMSGGMFSQLQAASVPTTYEDPPHRL